MPYFFLIIFSVILMAQPAPAENKLNSTLEGVESQITELNTTIQNVDSKIIKTEDFLQKKQDEEGLLRQNLVKQLNTFNGTIKDIIRMQRLPQKALVILDGLKGHNQRQNILEKGQETLQNKIKNDKKALSSLLKNLTNQENILKDLNNLKKSLNTKQKKFAKLRKIQAELLTLDGEEKEILVKKAIQLENSLNLNNLFKNTKIIKKHTKTNISYHNLPVEGIITVKYNETDEKGIHSQGLYILSTPSATVKAVKGGHIIYSNIFREYGYLVILEHSDGYHTLYSGLNGGSKEIGDFISSGGTIGVLPAIEKPVLYLEVRKDGVAVNPKKLLKRSM